LYKEETKKGGSKAAIVKQEESVFSFPVDPEMAARGGSSNVGGGAVYKTAKKHN
jgi:hypothetical protein